VGLFWGRRAGTPAVVVIAAFVMTGVSGASLPIDPSPRAATTGYLYVGDVQRSYTVYRPASAGAREALALVIAMHGYTSNSLWMETASHFDQLAELDRFEVAYPQGIGDAWNAGSCCGHDVSDDVEFIRELIDRLVAAGGVDRTHVFATGMSNGALMAQRLACDLAGRITAAASVSGSLVTESCSPSRPISVLEIHGLEDTVIPYAGGTVGGLTDFPSTMTTMRRWSTLDGCSPAPALKRAGITSTYTWTGCRDGSSVVLEAVAGAGHTWFSAGQAAGEPDASRSVLDFFRRAPALP
jgi:polyhydroxybutyrate depolymerase